MRLALNCSKYSGTKNKWYLFCSAKQWCFHVCTPGFRVTKTSSPPPAPFLCLVHTCRLGKQRQVLTELWQLGFVSCTLAVTLKLVFLSQVVWWHMDRFWFSLSSSLSLLLPGCSLLSPFVLPQLRAPIDSTREGMGSHSWFPPVFMGNYLDFCGKSIFSLCLE